MNNKVLDLPVVGSIERTVRPTLSTPDLNPYTLNSKP